MELKEGIYCIYKPAGITTYDIIRYIKKQLKNKKIKIGHGGTLDPFAEGVVVVGVGRKYTKQLHNILNNSKKEYIAEILLDRISDTYDVTGDITNLKIEKIPQFEEVKKVIESFLGEQEQLPPLYSAKKIKGERLCDLIRFGKVNLKDASALLKPKKIKIYNIEILEYKFPKLSIKVLCSSGTYIRSLARDIGSKLGCGGIVNKLIRTKVDNYKIEDTIKV